MGPLNYRHAFHAGNFADVAKHALLLAAIARLRADPTPLTVFDTHAGAGVYDLDADASRRSGEAQAGITKLLADPDRPDALKPLVDAVTACNDGGRLRLYPGSPWLAAHALRRGDRYIGCELRPDDAGTLHRSLFHDAAPNRVVHVADGYVQAARHLAAGRSRTLLLIDPPYERADDYARIAALVASRPHPERQPALVWMPLKDLETFDGFLGRLEAAQPSGLMVAQVRLHALADPMRLNGCALALIDLPDLTTAAEQVCSWVADRLGGPEAEARVARLA